MKRGRKCEAISYMACLVWVSNGAAVPNVEVGWAAPPPKRPPAAAGCCGCPKPDVVEPKPERTRDWYSAAGSRGKCL